MSALPTHRELEWQRAISEFNRNRMHASPRFIDMSIVWDMDTQFNFNTTKTKIAAGDIVRTGFFKTIGHELCKKVDATLLVIIGEKTPEGCWLIGKCKNYWLKPLKQ